MLLYASYKMAVFMGNKANQRGQAITEMVIGLLGMLTVFLGLLFVAAMGIENIDGMLLARRTADENAVGGAAPGGGTSILEWLKGNDMIAYTTDDTVNGGTGEASENYKSQLAVAYADPDQSITLNDPLSIGGYSVNSELAEIPDGVFFLWAARLTEGQYSNADPLESRNLNDLKGAFRSLLGTDPNFMVEQNAYMSIATE
jgi:hypothetical protein